MYLRFACCCAIAAAIAAQTGCSKSSSLPTVPVSGTVNYKGAPVEGATVSFVNKSTEGKSASGRTNSSGQFRLVTYAGGSLAVDGAVPGEYDVTITKSQTATGSGAAPPRMAPPGDPSKMSPEEMAKFAQMSGQRPANPGGNPMQDPTSIAELPKVKHELPEKYASEKTSGFSEVVTSEQHGPYTYDLVD